MAISSILDTEFRRQRGWKTCKRFWIPFGRRHERGHDQSRFGSEIQSTRTALHILSARDAVRAILCKGSFSRTDSRKQSDKCDEPIIVFSSAVLPVALLVLRMHYHHHYPAKEERLV